MGNISSIPTPHKSQSLRQKKKTLKPSSVPIKISKYPLKNSKYPLKNPKYPLKEPKYPSKEPKYPSKDPKFLPPKNVEDLNKMKLPHYLYQIVWQTPFSSPIHDVLKLGGRVLDAGCSTGVWVLDMAKHYPNSDFVGCDILQVFPSSHEHQRDNVKFIQVNILDGLPFGDNSFDFIRMSLFVATFTVGEWLLAIKELTRVLTPGGWLELMEPDYGLYKMGPTTLQFTSALLHLFSMRGLNGDIARKLELILAASEGLTNTHHSIRHVSIGPPGGTTGILFEEMLTVYFTNVYGESVAEYLNVTPKEYQAMWKTCGEEFMEHQTYCKTYRFWSQKEL